jgi:fatty-acyl-CoA synthase/long-chain acyl-CoA synthetase
VNIEFIQRNHTLDQALRDVVRHYPDREALVFGDQRITFGQLGERVDTMAASLRRLGVDRGDKVGIILPNCPEFIYAIFATVTVGAVAVPMSAQSGFWEVEHILGDAEAVAVVTDVEAGGTDLLGILEGLRPALPHLEHVIVRGHDAHPGTIAFDDMLPARPDAPDLESASEPADPAMILYTSGTTGTPKGAVHSHRTLMLTLNVLLGKLSESGSLSWEYVKLLYSHLKTVRRLPWLVESVLALRGWAQSKLMVMTPFYHVAGYVQVLVVLLTGDKLVVMQRFHPEEALRLIEKERITQLFGVPPMFEAMLARPNFDQYDLSSIMLSITGAMPVPPHLIQEIEDRIGGFAAIVYGATEVTAATVTSHEDPTKEQAETVGRADFLDGVDVRIVDDERRELPPGQVGEIAVRAPTLMEGYHRQPEATAMVVDQEGWYYTGDLGVMDESRYVRVMGRRSDMIIRAGANIYPAEIENFLLAHPQIKQVAVIGVPGPGSIGELVRAYVVSTEDGALEAGDVLEYCWGRIASYKVPNEIVFVEELPVTSALQKVRHVELRQKALRERQAAEPEGVRQSATMPENDS